MSSQVDIFFFSSRRRHTRWNCDWSSDVCSSDLGREFPGLGDVVRELVGAGMRVSIDSFDPDEIRAAVTAGAELVLSINASNRAVARELAGSETRVVVIPDFGQGVET